MNRTARLHRQRQERGSVAIEAALVIPMLMLVLFGIVEFSMLLRDHVSLTAAARSGARIGSAEPRMSTFTTDMAAAVARAGTGMPASTIQELWVYEANVKGYPTNGGSILGTGTTFTACTTRCKRFTYSGGSFTAAGGSWDATDVNACPGDAGMTSVGVYIRARHRFISGLFGSSVQITDHAVMRFEPIPASALTAGATCK
ncbi:MAG: TadE/TadG family type IV pilus assembly protein [Candidatus Nanopelagicales bacterium]